MIDQILNEEITKRQSLSDLSPNSKTRQRQGNISTNSPFSPTRREPRPKRFSCRNSIPTHARLSAKANCEIRAYIEDNDIGMAIFDDDLSSKQVLNIERELKVKILDRTA